MTLGTPLRIVPVRLTEVRLIERQRHAGMLVFESHQDLASTR